MVIRNAKKEDIPQITELWKELMDLHGELDPYYKRKEGSEKGYMDALADKLNEEGVFVSENDNKITGYIQCIISKKPPCFMNRDYGMIENMYIFSEYRYKLIGYNLFHKAKEWFKERGIKRIEVRIHKANSHALSFWKSAGMKSYLETGYLDL